MKYNYLETITIEKCNIRAWLYGFDVGYIYLPYQLVSIGVKGLNKEEYKGKGSKREKIRSKK